MRRGVADLDFVGGPRSEGGNVIDGREEATFPVVRLCEEGMLVVLGLGKEKRRQRRRRGRVGATLSLSTFRIQWR